MNIIRRFQKEANMFPYLLKGYSRSTANAWCNRQYFDMKKNEGAYSKSFIKELHKKGFLCSSIERYKMQNEDDVNYITDFEYTYLAPFNNSYTKWLEDILTTNRVLKAHEEHCRSLYYSIIQRDGETLILKIDNENKEYFGRDIIETLKEKQMLELRPAFWNSTKKRFVLSWCNECLYVNGESFSEEAFSGLINGLKANYIVADKIDLFSEFFAEEGFEHYIKLWISNDYNDTTKILFAAIYFEWRDEGENRRKRICLPIDLAAGTYLFDGKSHQLPDWKHIQEELISVSESLKAISFYSCTIALQADKPFIFLNFSGSPILPEIPFDNLLNNYLKERFGKKNLLPKPSMKKRWNTMKGLLFNKFVHMFCRPGIRPYMQKLWFKSVRDDFLNTKDVSLLQKIWCWRRGYLSFRTYQYGLTKENYEEFLSDYDYHYLNRINNDYQKWINDKTTTRFILEPFKKYIPDYYFLIIKRYNQTKILPMWDCPEKVTVDYNGLFQLLKEKKKLALKASAGTHGDGFYCLQSENDTFTVNGQIKTEDQIIALIESFNSFYVVTEYIEMHSFLKNIYPNSVNTIRMMVINRKGFAPRIMQTYMRIGSSRTGFTDNVGYGGICVMVDKETGQLYQPETISNHKFYDCPNHPDTGTSISGFLPNWDIVCQKVLEISQYLCELEYLGFDVAITEDDFCLLEINIHQDLHKVAKLDKEVIAYYQYKIQQKKKRYNIK